MVTTPQIIEAVWSKGAIVPTYDTNRFRKDPCGAWMVRDQYGSDKSIYGWEIDHIVPVSHGGSDNISNLRPVQWESNRSRQDGNLSCPIVSSGNINIKR